MKIPQKINVDYQFGDLVWIYTPVSQKGLSKKLMKFWAGPYLLIQQTGPVNFRVKNLQNNKLVSSPIHVNRMKFVYDRYVRPNNEIFPSDPKQQIPVDDMVQEDLPDDSFIPLKAKQGNKKTIQIVPGIVQNSSENVEFEVKRILRGRYRNNQLQYLIKWQNFPSKYNSWEPIENLNPASLDYLKQNPVRITGKINT